MNDSFFSPKADVYHQSFDKKEDCLRCIIKHTVTLKAENYELKCNQQTLKCNQQTL